MDETRTHFASARRHAEHALEIHFGFPATAADFIPTDDGRPGLGEAIECAIGDAISEATAALREQVEALTSDRETLSNVLSVFEVAASEYKEQVDSLTKRTEAAEAVIVKRQAEIARRAKDNSALLAELEAANRERDALPRIQPGLEDGKCVECGEQTCSLAGDPGRWPVYIGNGQNFHVRCVWGWKEQVAALTAENQRCFGKIDELESTLEDEETGHAETFGLWKKAREHAEKAEAELTRLRESLRIQSPSRGPDSWQRDAPCIHCGMSPDVDAIIAANPVTREMLEAAEAVVAEPSRDRACVHGNFGYCTHCAGTATVSISALHTNIVTNVVTKMTKATPPALDPNRGRVVRDAWVQFRLPAYPAWEEMTQFARDKYNAIYDAVAADLAKRKE